MYDVVISDLPLKLQVEFDTILMPQTTSSSSLITDTVIVLLEAQQDALVKKGLVDPLCIVNIHGKSVLLPIISFLMEPVVLPEGFEAAVFETESCAQGVTVLVRLSADISLCLEAAEPSD